MDGNRFDNLSRKLAAGVSRRTAVKGAAAGLLAALGVRKPGGAQVSQATCGNVLCASNPGVCKPGCVCCVFSNGNNRCMPPGNCTGTITCAPGLQFCANLGRCAECCGDADCDDGSACTTDTCTDGTCLNTPITCPANEVCDASTGDCCGVAGSPCGTGGENFDILCCAGFFCRTSDDTCRVCRPVNDVCTRDRQCCSGVCNRTDNVCAAAS